MARPFAIFQHPSRGFFTLSNTCPIWTALVCILCRTARLLAMFQHRLTILISAVTIISPMFTCSVRIEATYKIIGELQRFVVCFITLRFVQVVMKGVISRYCTVSNKNIGQIISNNSSNLFYCWLLYVCRIFEKTI